MIGGMKPSFIFFSLAIAIAGVMTAPVVFAVGGGGGGGGGGEEVCSEDIWTCSAWSTCDVDGSQTRSCTLADDCEYASTSSPSTSQPCTPTCTEDAWTCSDWSDCSADNLETRTCVLSNDCALVDDPSPATDQSCAETCTTDTFSCGAWSACSVLGTQSRACAVEFDCPEVTADVPVETQACTPDCAQDVWNCSDWGSCDTNGDQHRVCTLTTDCALAEDPKPAEAGRCDHVQCGDLPTMDERVSCRLALTPQGVHRELELHFLPEACAVLSGEEQAECVEYYRAFQECWAFPVGTGRFNCAKRVLGIDGDISEAKAACEDDEGCLGVLREKTYALIAFRMYDLEERAEDFAEEGADLALVTDMVVSVIEHKIDFAAATNYNERRAVLEDLQEEWAVFVRAVQEQLSE